MEPCADLVMEHRSSIDARLDGVMVGWRLSRLLRIDRDIPRPRSISPALTPLRCRL